MYTWREIIIVIEIILFIVFICSIPYLARVI
jgi:hypothetical protein